MLFHIAKSNTVTLLLKRNVTNESTMLSQERIHTVPSTSTTIDMSQHYKVKLHNMHMPQKVKNVHFVSGSPIALEPPPQHQQVDADLIWYTPDDLKSQMNASKRHTIPKWQEDGFEVLLQDSYKNPHINVQDYLNAFCAQSSEFTVRGLETSSEAEHAQERSTTKRLHKRAILDQQRMMNTTLRYCTTPEQRWERLAQTSRESSSRSKLFAMRMGRADARVVQKGENSRLAQEIVKRRHHGNAPYYQQQQQQQDDSTPEWIPLSSLVCLEAPASSTFGRSATPLKPQSILKTSFPVTNTVVYGRYTTCSTAVQ